ncbi:hypothetical protein VNO77_09412 [Canavalia gladiata]|uniref:Uncharacterized protein n=1 Tax=Canavalia gladiata TaxID=3824 RepID=A0AAN9MFV2_CANGL
MKESMARDLMCLNLMISFKGPNCSWSMLPTDPRSYPWKQLKAGSSSEILAKDIQPLPSSRVNLGKSKCVNRVITRYSPSDSSFLPPTRSGFIDSID